MLGTVGRGGEAVPGPADTVPVSRTCLCLARSSHCVDCMDCMAAVHSQTSRPVQCPDAGAAGGASSWAVPHQPPCRVQSRVLMHSCLLTVNTLVTWVSDRSIEPKVRGRGCGRASLWCWKGENRLGGVDGSWRGQGLGKVSWRRPLCPGDSFLQNRGLGRENNEQRPGETYVVCEGRADS